VTFRAIHWVAASLAAVLCVSLAGRADEQLPDSDALLRALSDELARSMQLQMEDLEQPYFIQLDVEDSLGYVISAEYGAITGAQRSRSRTLYARVRVGSYELDNTNFADEDSFFPFGGGQSVEEASLPIDEDYLAIRQAIWLAADQAYKDAVETLTKKKAYMRDKNVVDRPNDFSAAPVSEKIEPPAVLRFDEAAWKEKLKRVSARFKQYEQVRECGVRLFVAAGNDYLVNSEGTRLRTGDAGALLVINAAVQAEDGMHLSDSRSYTADSADDLPPIEKLVTEVDELVEELTAASRGTVLEHYSGPMLLDDLSAGQMLRTLLATGLAGKPDPVGQQAPGFLASQSLESKIGTRVFPKGFEVWDEPGVRYHDGTLLLGHYRYDAEGVPASRVTLVADGKLESLCLSRAPLRKLSGSNGHARRGVGSGEIEPAIGCLFVEHRKAVPNEELKEALIAAAKEAGLEYGLRIKSIRLPTLTSTRAELISMFTGIQRSLMSGGGMVGDPVLAYKVYVADGHEEPVRGCRFGQLDVTALKRIIAAGDRPAVYNYIGLGLGGVTPPTSIIAPPILFEELELSRIEQEFDKPPILKAPLFRT